MTSKKNVAKAVSTASPLANKNRKVVVLPGEPSKDFIVNAPCRILNVTGVGITITAADLPGDTGGTYVWKTNSTKIRLLNATSPVVIVKAIVSPSSARDAEIITVTRTDPNGSKKDKTVKVTVAKVTFSASPNQKYGFDDFDTPSNPVDNHICVKKSDFTFVKVTIEGGALGSDFDFICKDQSVCKTVPPGASASFDLRLNAEDKIKNSTELQAKIKCPSAAVFAEMMVHVYAEKLVNVVVAKIHDSTSAGTALNFPTADYAAHATVANNKLKEAVVKYDIVNFKADNSLTDIRFDMDGNGTLSYDIAAGGGVEVQAIRAAMPIDRIGRVRVAIVKSMKSYYYLSSAAAIGDVTITVRGTSVFSFSRPMPLGSGASSELVTVRSSAGNVITLSSPLTKNHVIGETLEFAAGGWSGSPIIIMEGSAALSVAKWTVLHEVGHTALLLSDITDATDFMHFMQSWTDYRLRFCPRIKHYRPTQTENQWETIPRR